MMVALPALPVPCVKSANTPVKFPKLSCPPALLVIVESDALESPTKKTEPKPSAGMPAPWLSIVALPAELELKKPRPRAPAATVICALAAVLMFSNDAKSWPAPRVRLEPPALLEFLKSKVPLIAADPAVLESQNIN